MPSEYGILIYDVPTESKALYTRLSKRIYQNSIRMNLSVYLIPWGMKQRMQDIIDEAIRETGQRATVSILKFDTASKEEIERIAIECLRKDIQDTIGRLRDKIQEAAEDGKNVSGDYLNNVRHRLVTIENQAILFAFSQDIEGVLNTAKSFLETQWSDRMIRIKKATEIRKEAQEA